MGGGDEDNSFNSVEVFDVSIQKWRLVASMCTERCDLGVGVLHNRLYAVNKHIISLFLFYHTFQLNKLCRLGVLMMKATV